MVADSSGAEFETVLWEIVLHQAPWWGTNSVRTVTMVTMVLWCCDYGRYYGCLYQANPKVEEEGELKKLNGQCSGFWKGEQAGSGQKSKYSLHLHLHTYTVF